MKGTIQLRRSTAILSAAVVLLVAALAGTWAINSNRVPAFVTTAHAAGAELPSGGTFAPIVKRTAPAVVNVSSSKVVKNQGMPSGFFDDPMFKQFFGQVPRQPREQKMHSLGSGVIVSTDGYILTNNHVIDGATDVKVTFADGKEVPAKVVGADAPTDVAVLKIDRTGLTAMPIGDSSKSEVGDLVLAIGNPLGVGQSVSMGIVSAKSRNLKGAIENYEDFIQTDAAINHGNSGGALVNTSGELIGINTAILGGDGGGNIGIGFAIPSNLAKGIMNQLVEKGKVTRGFIGILPQEITPDMRQAFGLTQDQGGIAVAQVSADSPASKAGLQVGDVIVSLNGEKVEDVSAFRLKVASFSPGSKVALKVIRDGATKDYSLTLATNTEVGKLNRSRDGQGNGGSNGTDSGLQGVQVDNLSPEAVQQLNLPANTKGVLVTDVDESSAAAEAGLRPNDVIERVNHQPVTTVDDLDKAMQKGSPKGGTLLLVRRGAASLFVVVPSK
jgi:Do/DeqQ family serine protease